MRYLERIAITDRKACGGTVGLMETVTRHCEERTCTAVMLREKDLPPRQLYELACRLKDLCNTHAIALIVNDSVEVALACNADGIHCGASALPLTVVKNLMESKMLLGASCHDAEDLETAARVGVSYAFLSPVFCPTCKPGVTETLGWEGFSALVKDAPLPVVAVGGLDPTKDLPAAKTAGAVGIASIGAYFPQR